MRMWREMATITAEMRRGERQGGTPGVGSRPLGFLWRYVSRHPWGHASVFLSVLVAVVCAVSVQYGMKMLVDIVAAGPARDGRIWWAFATLCGLVATDNLLWRV